MHFVREGGSVIWDGMIEGFNGFEWGLLFFFGVGDKSDDILWIGNGIDSILREDMETACLAIVESGSVRRLVPREEVRMELH